MVGRKPNGNKAKKAVPSNGAAQARPDGEYQQHTHYDEHGVFHEDGEVDHAAVAQAASKKTRRLRKTTSLVLLAFVGMASLISVNAAFLQDGKHPSPLVATRNNKPQIDRSSIVRSAQRLQRQELVVEIQRELRRLEVYPGSLDGQFGPATERAVRAYQRSRGLQETGLLTEALLARLTMDFNKVDVSAMSTTQNNSAINAVPLPRSNPDAIADLTRNSVQSEQADAIAAAMTERIKRLQKTLVQLGYGPLTIDGIPGGQTASAIAAFQREYKLEVDGKLSEALILKLTSVSGVRI